MTSLWEKISLIPVLYQSELDSARLRWREASAAIFVYLLCRNLVIFIKFLLSFLRKRCSSRKDRPNYSFSELKESMRLDHIKSQILENWAKFFTRSNLLRFLPFLGFNCLGLALLLVKGLAYAVNYQFLD
jgi:hypothetical protein